SGPASADAASAAKPAPTASSGWSDQRIDMSALDLANADLALTAGEIVFQKITIGKSALTVQLTDGKLAADLSSMEFYSGSRTGTVTFDNAPMVPAVQASFNLAKIQAEPLLRDAMGLDRLSGRASGNVAVASHGKSERELIGALSGKGDLHLTDCTIRGIDVG